MTLPDLRAALQELLPHTTIDIVGTRLHVILADPIGVIGIALNASGNDYEVGAAYVRCPQRSYDRKPPTPATVVRGIRYEVSRRWAGVRNSRHLSGEGFLLKALNILAASDFAALAIEHLDTELRQNAAARVAADVDYVCRVADLTATTTALTERRAALLALTPTLQDKEPTP